MRKRLLPLMLIAGLFLGGCGMLPVETQQQLTDPNSTIQRTAQAVLEGLEAARPLEKIIETTPIGLPVSAIFNGALLIVTAIVEMRRRQTTKSLDQVVTGVQVARTMLKPDARELLDTANRHVQDPDTAGMVKAVKAAPQNILKVQEAKMGLLTSGRWPA